MIVAVDIGGTKTLIAVFDFKGKILEQKRFETSQNYKDFLNDLQMNLANLSTKTFSYGAVAVPAKIDRENGATLGYGTLKWQPQPIQNDTEKIFNCPVVVENDSKLAGLSEALLLKSKYENVLYVTIGTGISCALITKGIIDPAMADSEGGQILISSDGKMAQWEDVVSGKAIVKRFGKRASDITDSKTWDTIAHDMSVGLIDLIAVTQPQAIVMGGGVSTNFDKFSSKLTKSLKNYATPLVPIPPILSAKNPEEAVVYGCYEIAKAKYGHISK